MEVRMGRVAAATRGETGLILLEAAKSVLRQSGYSGFSTRDVAARAGVPLSQIHYHFGSKQGLVLALFEHLNAQLLDRQNTMFGDPTLTLSERWDRACDYLEEDIASGYVRVAQELIAAGWTDPAIAAAVRAAIMGGVDLLTAVAVRRVGPGHHRPLHGAGTGGPRRQRLISAEACSAGGRAGSAPVRNPAPGRRPDPDRRPHPAQR
jgi:AcrR family transcriptional regulator